MTVTEEAVGSANGAAPDPNLDGIDYLDDGTVRFVIDGAPFVLRRPKIGTFKKLHAAWVSNGQRPIDEQMEAQLNWVRLLFNGDAKADPPVPGLADHPLPDDPDEWPAWVGVAQWQGKVMVHFRDVPLARGGQAPAQV